MIDSSRKARGKSERRIVTTKTRCRQGSRFLSNLLRFLLNVLYGPSLVVPFDNADYFLVPNDNTTVNQRKNRAALDCQVVWNLACRQIILEGLRQILCNEKNYYVMLIRKSKGNDGTIDIDVFCPCQSIVLYNMWYVCTSTFSVRS